MDNLVPSYRYLFRQFFYLLVFFITVSQQMTNSGAGSDLTEGSSYFFYQHSEYPRDCQEIVNQCSAANTVTSGVYLIKPDGYPEPFEVFCDNSIESGGWTVIQRRVDGSVDFNRNWVEHKKGFGFLSSEFWLGNEKVSFLANQKTYELQINMVNVAGSSFYVHYDLFRISDDWGDFKLTVLGEYSGNASSVTVYCPTNMEYGSCSCQASCSDLSGCQKDCNDGEETCICPNGFFLDQYTNCVTLQECTCYVQGFSVIPDGDSYVTTDCSRRCSCNNNQLNCETFQCSTDATCQEIGGEGQCQCNEGFEGNGIICTLLTTTATAPTTMSDCLDLYNAGNGADGIYTINPSGLSGSEFQVYCDMTTDGGGWTVFQRRVNGAEPFYRDWAAYKVGFGPLGGEHWLGNDNLHAITSPKDYQLRVDIVNSGGSSYHALYNVFRVSAESDNYRLTISSYTGTAGSGSFDASNGDAFSTYDRDNDYYSSYNCAEKHQSGWWYPYNDARSSSYCRRWFADGAYRYCTNANLNGDYSGGDGENIFWGGLPGNSCNIPQTEMKIRPV